MVMLPGESRSVLIKRVIKKGDRGKVSLSEPEPTIKAAVECSGRDKAESHTHQGEDFTAAAPVLEARLKKEKKKKRSVLSKTGQRKQ